jgi:hypothetical protein
MSHHLQRIDRYTTLWAQQALAEGRNSGAAMALAGSAWAFFRNYILRHGFLLGEAGLTVSTLNAYYTYLKLAKLQELRRRGDRVDP